MSENPANTTEIAKIDQLSPKRAIFVREYLIDLNGTQAAIRAGYSAKSAEQQASRLLNNVKVSAAVRESMDARIARVELSQDYVLKTILDTVERCRQATPVLDRKGEQILVAMPSGKELVPAFTFEPIAVIKGCELLGKHLGIWNEVGSKTNPLTSTPSEASDLEVANRLAALVRLAKERKAKV